MYSGETAITSISGCLIPDRTETSVGDFFSYENAKKKKPPWAGGGGS